MLKGVHLTCKQGPGFGQCFDKRVSLGVNSLRLYRGLYWGHTEVLYRLYWGNIRVILGLYWCNAGGVMIE